MGWVSTSLKLKLFRGDEVILEVPLSVLDWPKEQLETEFEAFEEDFNRFSCMFIMDVPTYENQFIINFAARRWHCRW